MGVEKCRWVSDPFQRDPAPNAEIPAIPRVGETPLTNILAQNLRSGSFLGWRKHLKIWVRRQIPLGRVGNPSVVLSSKRRPCGTTIWDFARSHPFPRCMFCHVLPTPGVFIGNRKVPKFEILQQLNLPGAPLTAWFPTVRKKHGAPVKDAFVLKGTARKNSKMGKSPTFLCSPTFLASCVGRPWMLLSPCAPTPAGGSSRAADPV